MNLGFVIHEALQRRAARLSFVVPTGTNTLKQTKVMKKQVTRISILQSSKIVTALYVLMGCIYTLIGIPMIIFGGKPVKIMGTVYLFMPLIMAVFGFLFFALFSWIYNVLANLLGGIEVEVKDVDQP
jgi:ABC-type polysaccharide/polyol phosphate export permease